MAGFKPAFGSVPADGLWPLAPSFDHVGPLARTIDDCALAFGVLRGAPLAERDPAGLRVHRLEAAELARTTESFLPGRACPRRPPLVRLHLAEVAEVHREIYASHRDAYDDDLHAKMAVGLAVLSARARRARRARCARGAPRVRATCDWDVLLSPAYPGDLPPRTCR